MSKKMTYQEHFELSRVHCRKALDALKKMRELHKAGRWEEGWKYWEIFKEEDRLDRKHYGIGMGVCTRQKNRFDREQGLNNIIMKGGETE